MSFNGKHLHVASEASHAGGNDLSRRLSGEELDQRLDSVMAEAAKVLSDNPVSRTDEKVPSPSAALSLDERIEIQLGEK